jgi:signal transduction histidine kinase
MRRSLVARVWPAAAITLAGWLSTAGLALAQTPGARSVLTIHSGSEFFPSNPIMDSAIREVLLNANEGRIDYYAEYLESDRFGPDVSAALADYVGQKYRSRHIDVVIALTNDALTFVLDHRAELFPNVPVVFAGVTVPDETVRNAGHGVAVVRVGSAYVQTLKLALQLHPATERVYVLARSANQQDAETARAQLGVFSKQVKLTFIDEETLTTALEIVRNVPPRSIVLHIWQKGGRDDMPDPVGVARSVAEAAPVPVYGTVDLNVGTGIVGGVVRGTRQTGTRVAEIALQILDGAQAQRIPVDDAPLVPIFDWRQIKRWDIDPSRLPSNSELRFWTPTVWEAYRPYIIGTIVVVAAQLLAIAGLLVQRERRRRAEAQVRASEATIRTSYERIRQLAGRLINAQEAARAGIARDLHDGVCQELAGVSIAVGSLKNSSGQIQDAQAQQALAKIQTETLGMFEGIRRLSHELHPATLRLVGLASALQAHCTEMAKRHGVAVAFAADGEFTDLDPDLAVAFFRMAQEALRNGIVHGRAGQLSVSLVRSPERVELTVTDNGTGFDLDAARRNGSGLGLVSLEERAHVLGGEAQVITAPGAGTTVRVRSPAGSAAAVL